MPIVLKHVCRQILFQRRKAHYFSDTFFFITFFSLGRVQHRAVININRISKDYVAQCPSFLSFLLFFFHRFIQIFHSYILSGDSIPIFDYRSVKFILQDQTRYCLTAARRTNQLFLLSLQNNDTCFLQRNQLLIYG